MFISRVGRLLGHPLSIKSAKSLGEASLSSTKYEMKEIFIKDPKASTKVNAKHKSIMPSHLKNLIENGSNIAKQSIKEVYNGKNPKSPIYDREVLAKQCYDLRKPMPPVMKRSGNVAVMKAKIGNVELDMYAHSQVSRAVSVGSELDKSSPLIDSKIPYLKIGSRDKNRMLIPGSEYPRKFDTEHKLLSYAKEIIESGVKPEGSIHIHTENKPCESCELARKDFIKKFPGIKVVYSWGRHVSY